MPEILLPSDYTPFSTQIAAHNTPSRWVLYGGGEGGGKTRWMVEELKRSMLFYPGLECLVGRQDQNDVFQATQIYDAFHRYCPPELIEKEYRSFPRTTSFYNGSRITWIGFKDWSASSELGLVAVDQAEEVDPEILQLLNGRLRQRLPSGMFPHFRMLLTCNPHPNIEWFLKKVVEFPEDYTFIKSLHTDNTFLPPDFKEQRRKSYTPEYFARLIEGNWDAFAGMALGEFSRDVHVVEPFDTWREKRNPWPVYLGIDFGTNAPTVGEWIAVSPSGQLFVVQEYERVGAGPEQTGGEMAELSKGMNLRGVWLDPRVTMVKADLNRRVTWSIWDEYKKQFKLLRTPVSLAKSSRESRLAAWQQALHPNPDLIDFRTSIRAIRVDCLQPGAFLQIR